MRSLYPLIDAVTISWRQARNRYSWTSVKRGRGGGLSPRRLRIVGADGNHPADLLIGRLILVMDKRRVVSVLAEQFFVIGAQQLFTTLTHDRAHLIPLP
ncbi:hypothetical protein NITHO_3070022 [Nitrolancea hollandica Lb]|uniref:Uncharacterized protein n=1 Tax=Nitrolancea hollandica Lb TaxID=1129897 RepID=I4EHD4_9BACT|nr:hypothetical protein NITHO_3070022 [Nitrolancea hollandica Lb]